MEYEAHLSQNPAYSSTYGSSSEQNVDHVSNAKKGRKDVTKHSEKTQQNHKSIDTRDIDSSRRYRSKSCINLRLCCLRLYRAKKRCCERVVKKPTRRVLERIKARSKECEQPDDTVVVAGVSTIPHRELRSHRDAPKKSKRSRKQDEIEEVAEDIPEEEHTEEEEKERRKRKREERKKKIMMEEERQERRERRKREKRIPHFVDTSPVARDDDLVVEDRIPMKPPSIADFTKSCCYLCAQNTLAIAAVSRPEQSDKSVQVSAHKFQAETLDKSCSPMLLVRTVQSSVRVRTREISTWCPGTSAVPPRVKKRRKFTLFPGLTRTKCPTGRHTCETDKSIARRGDNAEKHEAKNERCCREKNL